MKFTDYKNSLRRSLLVSTITLTSLLSGHVAFAAGPPSFNVTNDWMVGATQLSSARGLESMKLPCVLANQYDNGFVIRFSGGGKQILAMAIDFRQNAFQKGRKYNATVSIDNNYVKQVSAAAFTGSTLIFNLRPMNDFYAAAKAGKMMEITIDGNDLRLSLAA